ncbi:hypothetical protein EC973_004381 [Apophysomyces ossiformis]|uniref:N-acetyltransferase domain-containing protein n=1 Tax=Apophysomyces ossiformis TaxID=679940 RepID=A0A8H7ELS1_9FUNG|nr:hypothetical protein EC973_004381 [Apophysomyces ossiformis]
MVYQQDILRLNHCLFTRLAGTTLVRDDAVLAINPRNPGHQQSNLCFRLRLHEHLQDTFDPFLRETLAIFEQAGIQPRYIIDDLATPSVEALVHAFEQAGFHVERDYDVIMSRDPDHSNSSTMTQDTVREDIVRKATMQDHKALCALFGKAFGYEDTEWLIYKVRCQLEDPTTFPTYVIEQEGQVVSATILNLPPGLPIGHVNVCATLPGYQGQGLAKKCLDYALNKASQGRKMYLEVYDEISHAQRMYQQLGFKIEGTMAVFPAIKKDQK